MANGTWPGLTRHDKTGQNWRVMSRKVRGRARARAGKERSEEIDGVNGGRRVNEKDGSRQAVVVDSAGATGATDGEAVVQDTGG